MRRLWIGKGRILSLEKVNGSRVRLVFLVEVVHECWK